MVGKTGLSFSINLVMSTTCRFLSLCLMERSQKWWIIENSSLLGVAEGNWLGDTDEFLNNFVLVFLVYLL